MEREQRSQCCQTAAPVSMQGRTAQPALRSPYEPWFRILWDFRPILRLCMPTNPQPKRVSQGFVENFLSVTEHGTGTSFEPSRTLSANTCSQLRTQNLSQRCKYSRCILVYPLYLEYF